MALSKTRKTLVLGGLASFFLGSSLLQGKEVKFSAQDFAKAKALLCTAERVETLKAIGQSCTLESFTMRAEDLNGDEKSEWLFYGPSGECGAHGNCPLTLLKTDGEKWAPLSPDKCADDGCLRWANALYSEILKLSHNGYRDLLIASDSGSFFWIKEVFEWDGKQYRRNKNATAYYLFDSDKGTLVLVSKDRWEKCSKKGMGCL